MTLQPATIQHRNPRCLHCTIMFAISAFVKRHGERDPSTDRPILDMGRAIASLAEVIAELIQQSPDPAVRAEFQRYTRECIEAAFVASATGKPVAVSVNDSPRQH